MVEQYSYDNALVCINGHIVNQAVGRQPENNVKHCNKCGGEATAECSKCNTKINGVMLSRSSSCMSYRRATIDPRLQPSRPSNTTIVSNLKESPKYCHECGEAYPWTENKIKEAIQMLVEFGELSDTEKETIKEDVVMVTKDIPGTQIAAMRLKRIWDSGRTIARELLVDIASSTAAKIFTGKV